MKRFSIPTVFVGMIIILGLPASWAGAAGSSASTATSLAVPLLFPQTEGRPGQDGGSPRAFA